MSKPRIGVAIAVVASLALVAGTAVAAVAQVNYTGQGFIQDTDGTYVLKDERCGETGQGAANDGGTGQFADWNGPGQPYETGQPYLVWVLTANGATSATLHLPDGDVQMINVGGTWKYASDWYDPDDLTPNKVWATYESNGKLKNVQLVVSHGCRPFTTQGAWCSPGYWRNAADAAWALTGYTRDAKFNATVYDSFYGATFAVDPTLNTVLTAPGGTYKGPGVAGTDPRTQSPWPALNAFNATGAFLTDQIPGYQFDPSLVGSEDPESDEACPIDNHGNYKDV